MKFKSIYILSIALITFFVSAAKADGVLELTQPERANIGQSFFISHDWMGVYVPKSFEGRKANEDRFKYGFEYDHKFRYIHSDSEVRLKGTATTMNFDYKEDVIDVQIFRSKDFKPGTSSCMDCHGSQTPRTMTTLGYGQMTTDPYRYSGHLIEKAKSRYFKLTTDHWMKPNLILRSELLLGKLEQGSLSDGTKSFSVGLGGIACHKLTWSGDLLISKVDSFKARKSLIGNLAYTITSGLKFKLEAGALLDGYTQFGTSMSAMGMATAEPVKKYANWLPNFFKRLKDDAFGYYNVCLEYEYKF